VAGVSLHHIIASKDKVTGIARPDSDLDSGTSAMGTPNHDQSTKDKWNVRNDVRLMATEGAAEKTTRKVGREAKAYFSNSGLNWMGFFVWSVPGRRL
jgi:hypothetical protein